MNPTTVGSVTIIVPSVERVVIVFPATLDSAVVMVGDVLVAVHHPVRELAFEYNNDSRHSVEMRRDVPVHGKAGLMASEYSATGGV